MPRAPTQLQSTFPYHVSARCINKGWFCLPMDDVWRIMSEQLYLIHHAFGVRILSFVLMNNHFHLLLTTPESNIGEAMRYFMRETSRLLVWAGNRINQTYGGPHFRSIITSTHYYINVYKYVYYNPVAAGICDDVLKYRYSTLSGLLGQNHLVIPVVEDLTLFSDVEGTLAWLNRTPSKENLESIRKGLRRKVFKLAQKDSRPNPLEFDAL